MTCVHERSEFVDRKKMPNTIAELLSHVAGVVSERFYRVAVLPPAFVLQYLWQIPVVERQERCDARRDKFVHQPVVEVESFNVRRAGALRKDARPRNGEPISV